MALQSMIAMSPGRNGVTNRGQELELSRVSNQFRSLFPSPKSTTMPSASPRAPNALFLISTALGNLIPFGRLRLFPTRNRVKTFAPIHLFLLRSAVCPIFRPVVAPRVSFWGGFRSAAAAAASSSELKVLCERALWKRLRYGSGS